VDALGVKFSDFFVGFLVAELVPDGDADFIGHERLLREGAF
jgi:hypothetical protein